MLGLRQKTQVTAVIKKMAIRYKVVLALAICVALAAVLLSLGWMSPAKDHVARGDSLVKLQQWDEAIAAYTMAVIIDPKYVVAYNNRGYACAQKGHYDKAIADYNRAIEIDPEYARAYNNRGFAYDNYRDYNLAIADYTRAISIDPDYVTAYYNRGFAYRSTGEISKADADFRMAAWYIP